MTHNALKNGENSAIRKYFYSFEKKKDIQRTLKLCSENTSKNCTFFAFKNPDESNFRKKSYVVC